MADKSPQEQLQILLKEYLGGLYSTAENEDIEMEVRFGTRGVKIITRNDYDNVVKKLKSLGFRKAQEKNLLRIQNEYVDLNTGVTKISNIRTEIDGISEIQNYCRTDRINLEDEYSNKSIKFIQKQPYSNKTTNKTSIPANFDDFNFRASLSIEKKIKKGTSIVKNLLEKWNDSKKIFRYISRYSMSHYKYPFYIDLKVAYEFMSFYNKYL
jgi:hypothetical protein